MKQTIYSESLDSMNKTFKILCEKDSTPQVDFLNSHYTMLIKHYGERTAVAQLKAYYNEAIRLCIGLPVVALTPVWIKRDKENFPRILNKPFGGLLRSKTYMDKRRALSFLRTFESISLQPIEDLSSITLPSKGNQYFREIEPSWNYFLNNSSFARDIKRKFQLCLTHTRTQNEEDGVHLHFSSKSGLDGPTSLTAGEQSIYVVESGLDKYLINLSEKFMRMDFKETLKDNYLFTKQHGELLYSRQKTNLSSTYPGRLLFIPDKGGKTRLVAVGNYWIQESLRDLHKVLYKVLRRIPEDGTYQQRKAFDAVNSATRGDHCWSFDLTAATDRFPLAPQKSILSFLDKEIGDGWGEILNNLFFHYKGDKVRYSVGQPMGLYSSWASFTLTHHFVIQYCAFGIGIRKPFTEYRILGDDVTIWNKRVAKKYRSVMEALDVSISDTKSLLPLEDSKDKFFAEFAKRISLNGKEISPVSPIQSNSAWKRLSEFPMFLEWLRSHGYNIETIPVSRIFSVGKLSIYQRKIFVSLVKIWSNFKGPLLDLSKYLTEELEETFAQQCAMRLERLFQQEEALDHEDQDLRVDLEKIIGTEPINNHYFLVMLMTRKKQIEEERIEEPLDDLPEDDPDYEYHIVGISDIEFLPYLTVKDTLQGLTRKYSKQQLLGKFVLKTAKRALRSVSKSTWLDFSPGSIG